MKNIFTIDTEDWFHANYDDDLLLPIYDKSTVEENVERFLFHLSEHNAKATFFVLGYVARRHPELIRKISSQGHEIASHGSAHKLIYKQTAEEFRQDIRISKNLLEDIVGQPVIGYRAPSWSVTSDSLWALNILLEEGFLYDSSIFPTKNFLYGMPDAPRFFNRRVVAGREDTILEIPPSTMKLAGKNIPFSGGFYFRVMPYGFISKFTNSINKEGQPVVFYLHPREIDPDQPRLKLSARDALIHYWGINSCEKKFVKTLKEYSFTSIAEFYHDILKLAT